MIINIKTKPNSSKNEIIKISENNFEVKITKTPEKGKANKFLIKLLSKYFKTPQSNITITKGKTSKNKIIEILN